MEHQNQEHVPATPEKKKRVSFWSPEEMITPQIIHSEPDHPSLPTNQNLIEASQNSDVNNSHHHLPYPSYSNNAEIKFKPEPDFSQSCIETTILPSPQKKPKKEVDSTKPYKCSQCPYSFNRRDHLTRHSLVHSKLKPYHCSFCSKDFTRNDHLRRHQQRVHSEEVAAASLSDLSQRFICQECKAIFSSSGHLRAHIENKHHSDFSEFITHSDDPLRKNSPQGTTYVMVDGKKRPVCQLCNKSFSKKDHLTRHISSLHNSTSSAFETFTPEIQSYNCQICEKRFSRPEFLRRHIEDVHSPAGQMEILNHLNPNNSYNIQSSSSVHENGPHGMFVPPPPHMIQNTSGFFGFENIPMSSTSIVPKITKSISLKEYKCPICNKNFSRKYHLTRHQKSLHSGAFTENN